MIPKGDLEKIDRLVEEGRFASRADFGVKAVFMLLSIIDGTANEVKNKIQNEGTPATDFSREKEGYPDELH